MGVIWGEIPQWGFESHGYGSGYGSGYGDGYGDGSGYGYGYGSGDGSGDGYGSGSGDGYGSGYGDGSGYGSGSKTSVILRMVESLVDHPGYLALWKSDRNGQSCNGGRKDFTASVGLVQEIDGPLQLCGSRALHATLKPEAWQGERMWLVALHGEVIVDGNKVGALKREFLAEVPPV